MNPFSENNGEVHENERVRELLRYNILDTPDEEEFDDITKVAAYLFDADTAMINFLDHDRQWTKSNIGWQVNDIPRNKSVCTYTIQEGKYMVVNDLSKDDRFKDYSYVSSKRFQFYAGVVLQSRHGYKIGTICVLDSKPREINDKELEVLQVLGNAVESQLEIRLKREELIEEHKKLKKTTTFLQNSADIMMIIDPENLEIEEVNGDIRNLLGYDAEEMNSTALADYLMDERFKREFVKWVNNSTKEKFSEEAEFVTKDGNQLWLLVTVTKERGQFFATARDITRRKRAEKRFLKQLRFTEDILDHLPGTFFLIDSNGKMKKWNSNLAEVLNYTDDELKNKQYLELVAKEDRRNAQELFDQVITEGYTKKELKILSRDGEMIPYLLVSFKYEADDEEYVIGIGVDITEEKKALEETKHKERKLQSSLKEKEVLLKEIHHRVKNNLAIVSGLFELDIYNTEDEYVKSVLMSSQMRIKSMALIHESLYSHSDFADIHIGKYLEELTSTLLDTFTSETESIKLELDVENLSLNINQAIPLALLINELVINALKHAFPDGREGEIGITLRENDDLINLCVADSGIGIDPRVDIDNPETLGLTLIMNFVKQLQGEMKVVRSEGTSVNISFKKEQIKGSSAGYIPGSA